MTAVNKIDSNVTGLRYSEETSLGVADGAAVWIELEPNSYSDFGQQVTNVARAPIVNDRQRKKGVLTDLDASGGLSADLTQEVLPDMGQGVFYAALRTKDELAPAGVDPVTEDFDVAAGGDGYVLGDLLFAQGYTVAANNGLHEVSAGVPLAVTVTTDLITGDEATATGTIRRVGFAFAAGDVSVVVAGDFAHYLSAGAKDFTQLGILPGEWIFVGGDLALNQFVGANNNGFKRVRSVSSTQIVVDKSDVDMTVEAGGVLEIQIFLAPRMLKNESDPALIVRRSYQIERTLGDPDLPAENPTFDHQAEYLVGAVPSQLQMNIATADKMTFDLSLMGIDMEQVPSALASLKAGTRPSLAESDAYNSSSDVSRINMSLVSLTDESPTPMFTYIQEMSLVVDNTLTMNKAVGVFGAFDVTAGDFVVNGTLNAFFNDVASMQAIRVNNDVTIDFHLVKSNQGISIDLPLVTLGDGRPNVEKDAAIMIPISFEAASGAKVLSTYDHTLMMLWWDYLPDLADV